MSKDAASVLSTLIEGMIGRALEGLHVGFPCRVISFNEVTCTANVQPLLRTGQDQPAVIQNARAISRKRRIGGVVEVEKPYYDPGDVVFVVCADNELKNALQGNVATPDSSRKHDLNDAVIMGVFS